MILERPESLFEEVCPVYFKVELFKVTEPESLVFREIDWILEPDITCFFEQFRTSSLEPRRFLLSLPTPSFPSQ